MYLIGGGAPWRPFTCAELHPMIWPRLRRLCTNWNPSSSITGPQDPLCGDDIDRGRPNNISDRMSNPGYMKNSASFPTRAIQKPACPIPWLESSVVQPICTTTTFLLDLPQEGEDHNLYDNCKGYLYGRMGNATRDSLEGCIASLDEAKYGFTFASGMSGIMTVVQLLSAGDHIISMDSLYGGTHAMFSKITTRFGIDVDFVNCMDIQKVSESFRPNTRMVWVESACNPTLKLADIAALSKVVKSHGKAFLAVDNTFMTSYFMRPLKLGADIVFNSATKYMNGHSDVTMGCVCTNRDDLAETLRFLQVTVGAVPSPFDCYLVNRSLNTLELRMQRHMYNGLQVAKFLEEHPCVEKVLHPGLPSHPQHQLALQQCYGHSGMLSFCIKGDDLNAAKRFCQHTNVFKFAVSLGCTESLVEIPAMITHAMMSKSEREQMGVTDGLIRLSVGLESTQELLDDLDQALRKACPSTKE